MPVTAKKRTQGNDGAEPVDLVRALARFGPAYMRWVGRHLPEGGTSAPRLRLLGTLRERGSMSMRHLTRELSVSAQNVSVMVDGLEAQGLVARDQDPTDRRIVVVKLTPTGQARVDAGMATHQAAVSSLFDCLTERQRAEFAVALDRLCQELDLRLRSVR